VVARSEVIDAGGGEPGERLRRLVAADPSLNTLLQQASWDTPVRQISSYASDVSGLHGEGFALLGNAGEFLDPVFSSGVTIAFTSSSLAARCIAREFAGETVDWEVDFARPLRSGIDTFRAFVEAWYAGSFQKIIFYPRQQAEIRRMICSILAGYAWDRSNPYVADTPRRLAVLEQLCA
jgi:flavin-dependent dehydrogenase